MSRKKTECRWNENCVMDEQKNAKRQDKKRVCPEDPKKLEEAAVW